ncbi:tetratricopeptide repeat protein 28 [Python bivittatus]|uniref:Tetratricopeptide repeat protein 28 n=1 Tax=Python bivittatus TaxID=176946 RepID=A0A9F5MZG0_PYTBI|nr:tetratricopeptide repeat protein 28 [Python bivittatus]
MQIAQRLSECPLFPCQISLLGSKGLGDKGSSGPILSKAEFVEKVRQSNQACHAGDFHRAILLYGEALGVDPQNCILYSNRSAAYMKTQQYDRALEDAVKAQLLNPKWPKLLLSTGTALPSLLGCHWDHEVVCHKLLGGKEETV